MRRHMLLGLVASGLLLLVPTLGQGQSRGLTIGEIDNRGYRYLDGCGSPQIWPKGRGSYGGEGVFYVVPNDNGDGALMHLDGRVVNLRESGRSNVPRNLRRGSTFVKVYKGAGYTARLNYTVTKVDKANEHGGYYYAVSITVSKGRQARSVSGMSSDSC